MKRRLAISGGAKCSAATCLTGTHISIEGMHHIAQPFSDYDINPIPCPLRILFLL